MLQSGQIVSRLKAAGVRNSQIEILLGIPSSRVSEIMQGKRSLQLDEGVRLVEAFGLEDGGSKIPLIRVTAMPADTNPYGGVFGGWLMSQMALAAGSLASRHARGKCVVVAANELKFPGAPKVGDEISVYAEILKQGRSSLRIAVEAVARERDGEAEASVASGEFTFVALDANDRPREIAGQEEKNG